MAYETKQKISLKEMISMRKKEMSQAKATVSEVYAPDPYENSTSFIQRERKKTALCFETNEMGKHKNIWDENHPERPERLFEIINRLANLCLLTRGELISPKTVCLKSLIFKIHSPSLFERLANISQKQEDDLENEASNYDAVYFCSDTHAAALRALTCTINLVESVAKGIFHNGFAIVRPPGHHASYNDFKGYCFFNNVAIAAQHCIDSGYAKKILIFDYDVHHGDGTQRAFYDRKDVLYFSIHRYEYGTFWPNLRESSFDYIGKDEGKGFNVNVPLNDIGLEDQDYMAILMLLLLPIAYEYKPDLILISAGYDACLGCPEGQMNISPSFYCHAVSLLSGIANGRIATVLEGGYFIPSLAEGVALTIKGLHGDPCPLLKPIGNVNKTVIDSINNVRGALYEYWNCFSLIDRFSHENDEEVNGFEEHIVLAKFYGINYSPPFNTRDSYVLLSKFDDERFSIMLNLYSSDQRNYVEVKDTCYVFEEDTLLHKSEGVSYEKPERLAKIMELLYESKLSNCCIRLKVVERDDFKWCLEAHDKLYLEKIKNNLLSPSQDLYINNHTSQAAFKSVNALLTVVDAVMTDNVTNGAALIRPPGHHATIDEAQGFCFINNVAVAAKYALKKYCVQRILIIDFDVHHGNGTQDIFYTSNEVMYISIHRFDNGNFYPSKPTGGIEYVGQGLGEGYNVNIAFNGGAMGDTEYITAFLNVILPIAYSFNPQLVLVSAGFDAGIYDPLGAYKVNPEIFGQIISLLKPLANGKIILALEGGYNIATTAYSMIMCIKALKGQPIPISDDLFNKKIKPEAGIVLRNVIKIQKRYWPVLQVQKKISDKLFESKWYKEFNTDMYNSDKVQIET